METPEFHEKKRSASNTSAVSESYTSDEGDTRKPHPLAKEAPRVARLFGLRGELRGLYSCALERDVLWQGKLYLCDNHIAFYGKIFAKAAKVIINLNDVVALEKKSTVGMFPNAIRIQCVNTHYVFSSFLKRDIAFIDIYNIWKNVNPTAAAKLIEERKSVDDTLDQDLLLSATPPSAMGRGILKQDRKSFLSDTSNLDDDIPIIVTDDESTNTPLAQKKSPLSNDITLTGTTLVVPSELTDSKPPRTSTLTNIFKRNREATVSQGSPSQHAESIDSIKSNPTELIPDIQLVSIPAPSLLPAGPVDCNCPPEAHIGLIVLEETFKIDVSRLFFELFADGGTDVVREAHRNRETLEVIFGPWQVDENGRWTTRDMTYDVSFKAPMYGKTTIGSFETQTIIKHDEFVYCVETITKTPKAPFGDTFHVVNRYCISHVSPGTAKLIVRTRVEFSKKVMLKSAIEGGTLEGSKAFYNELAIALQNLGSATYTTDSIQPEIEIPAQTIIPPKKKPRPAQPEPKKWTQLIISFGIAVLVALPFRLYTTIFPPPPQKVKLEPKKRKHKNNVVIISASLVLLVTIILAVSVTVINIKWMNDVEQRLDFAIRQVRVSGSSRKGGERDNMYALFLEESKRRVQNLKNGLEKVEIRGVEELKWEVGEILLELAGLVVSERNREQKAVDAPAGESTFEDNELR